MHILGLDVHVRDVAPAAERPVPELRERLCLDDAKRARDVWSRALSGLVVLAAALPSRLIPAV